MLKMKSCCIFVLILSTNALCYQQQANEKSTRTYHRQTEVSSQSPSYTKFRPGRRVCSQHQTVTRQEPVIVSYSQSSYKPYSERCNENQLCKGIKLVYETAYKTVYQPRTSRHASFSCCPGWTQVAKVNHGCNQAQCRRACQNGGTCVKPDTCSCASGFTGLLCEQDINECDDGKTCDQLCVNTAGSFRCDCREGFTLLADGVSCRGEGIVATEARDLQGEFELLGNRIARLEKLVDGQERKSPPERLRDNGMTIADLSQRLDSNIIAISRRMNLIERHHEVQERHSKKSRCSDSELSPLRTKLASLERKLDACNCKYAYGNGIFT